MSDFHNLQRFVEAQDGIFENALAELGAGLKESHWMWFIFPQLAGLARSRTAQHFAIQSLEEARAFLAHPLLGTRLRSSIETLLPWAGRRRPELILGPIDAVKLRSSLTLFDCTKPHDLFERGLDSFFRGERDEHTLALLNGAQ